MPEYRVRWEIDLTADHPIAAAKLARRIQEDPASIAMVFYVTDEQGHSTRVDMAAFVEAPSIDFLGMPRLEKERPS